MGLRDIESTLPPGFRFFPSDEELVCHYLYKKVSDEKVVEGTMVEVDLHVCEPWELPEVAKLSANEWYFFSFRDRKYATGSRTNRATKSGYWKATGKDRTICHPSTHEIVGMRKTLVFYCGRAPNGVKSSWVMHEFRLENPRTPPKEDWVLCRVFHKRKVEEGEEMVNKDNMGSHCLSPLTINVVSPPLPPPPLPPFTGDQQILQGGESYGNLGGSISIEGPHNENSKNNSSSSSWNVDVANLLQFNFLESTPHVEMGEFGLFWDVGAQEGANYAMGYGNLGDFRLQIGKDKLY